MCGSENGGIQMAEADLNKILGYIQERERTLANYSDKLRQSLVKIADVFGNPQYCQRCNKWVEYHNKKWKDKPEGKSVCDNFKPKIQVSLDIVDDQPFLIEPEKETTPEIKYYLAIINHSLGYIDVVGEYSNLIKVTAFDEAPRETLKALIKSGRLIPFLQKVADILQAKSEEYGEVAEVAEKLAKAVQ
jgi:hypothetical protein